MAVDHSSRAAFIASMTPYAQRVAAKTGIPGSVLIAINLNERGWATPAADNNYFGIKASPGWLGPTKELKTWEVVNGQRVETTAHFRVYSSPEESYEDFVNLIMNSPRYKNAVEHLRVGNISGFVRGLNAAGYATDPRWADKILALSNEISTPSALPSTGGENNMNPRTPPPGWVTESHPDALYWRHSASGMLYNPATQMLERSDGVWSHYPITNFGQPSASGPITGSGTPSGNYQSGAVLPSSGTSNVPFYLILPNGQWQRHIWTAPGEGYTDEAGVYHEGGGGGWKSTGSAFWPTKEEDTSDATAAARLELDRLKDSLDRDYRRRRDEVEDAQYINELERQQRLDALDAWYKGEQVKLEQARLDLDKERLGVEKGALIGEIDGRGTLDRTRMYGFDDEGRPTLETGVALGRINGQSTLDREVQEAESRRRDVDSLLSRQEQAYTQEMERRKEAIDLAQNPEAELASAYFHAGLTPPPGSLMSEILARTGKRTPDVELFLEGQKRGGVQVDQFGNEIAPTTSTAPSTPPWYEGMDNILMEEAIRRDPSLAQSVPVSLLETFNNQLLLDLGWPVMSKLSPERLAGTGKFAGTGFSAEVQDWVAGQAGRSATTPATATTGTPPGQAPGQAPSQTPSPAPSQTPITTAPTNLTETPVSSITDPSGRAEGATSTALGQAIEAASVVPVHAPPTVTQPPSVTQPATQPRLGSPITRLLESNPDAAEATRRGEATAASVLAPTIITTAPTGLRATGQPGPTNLVATGTPSPTDAAHYEQPGGAPTATGPSGPASSLPAYTDPRRRLLRQGQRSELAGHIASGAVRPQLSKIFSPGLTATGTSERSAASGRAPQAYRPTGGLRPISAQQLEGMDENTRKSLSGLSRALGNDPDAYLGITERRSSPRRPSR